VFEVLEFLKIEAEKTKTLNDFNFS
jgi:hypothetical protein